jgi:hypothetical protein
MLGHIITQLVGRFVELAWPSSSFEVTKMYGMDASSLKTGRCEMMSIGLMSAARTSNLLQCECDKLWPGQNDKPFVAFANALYNFLDTSFYLPPF